MVCNYRTHLINVFKRQKRKNIISHIRTDHLKQYEREKLVKIIRKFIHVVYDKEDNLTFTNGIKHKIITKNDIPIYPKMYRYPEVLKEYIGSIGLVYLDDVLIFSTSIEEHLEAIEKMLYRLSQANLKLQIDKCISLAKETKFLGHVVTPSEIKPNPNAKRNKIVFRHNCLLQAFHKRLINNSLSPYKIPQTRGKNEC